MEIELEVELEVELGVELDPWQEDLARGLWPRISRSGSAARGDCSPPPDITSPP